MSVTKNTNALSEQLMAYFSLTADPFERGLEVFFEGAQRQHNLETLRHMSTFGDMVLLLTGEKGSGKTSLISRFVTVCSGELKVYVADVQNLTAKEKSQSVIHALSQSVGLERVQGETTRQSFSRLLQHLEEQFQKNGLRNVLVFDNADSLPKKELQFYFSYFSQLPKESGVAVIFSGLPALLQVARLSHIEGNEEWLHQMQLKPMAAPDMLEYLQLRLEKAGYKGLLELSETQVQHLIDSGKGLPGRINRLFASVVLEPASLKLPSKSSIRMPRRIIAGLFLLLGLSFLVVAYQYGVFEIEDGDEDSAVAIEVEKVGVELDFAEKGPDPLAQQRAARLKMLDQALSESLAGGTTSKPVTADTSATALPASVVKKEVEAKSSVGEIKAGRIEQSESAPQINSLESKAPKKEDSVLGRGTENQKEQEGQASRTGHEAPERKLPSKPFFKEQSWVESQSATAYSAQILGSYQEQTAIDFARRVSQLDSSIFYLKTLHRGRPWFVVFYGVFKDKVAAQAAIKDASKIIRSQQPWLRRFDGILKSYPR